MTDERLNELACKAGFGGVSRNTHRAKMALFANMVTADAREACAKEEEGLHVAICQAVTLLNMSPEVARCASGREANNILRQALANYNTEKRDDQ
jgi:hypothetical protein